MAEAVLAISIDSPSTDAMVAVLKRDHIEDPANISPESLEYRSVFSKENTKGDYVEIMGAGKHLDGYVIERGRDSVLSVEGPSVFDGYLSETGTLIKRDGAHVTRDLGFVTDGNVYLLGRADEIIVVRGRNIEPSTIESAAWGASRSGLAAAVPDGEGGVAVVMEIPPGSDPERQAQDVRRKVTQAVGIGPARVLIVEPGSLPKTASGKLRRREIAHRVLSGEFETVLDHRFGRKRDI
jgi:acyl-CoA synthetase (AMP-forming)/AMP-acid ligase II